MKHPIEWAATHLKKPGYFWALQIIVGLASANAAGSLTQSFPSSRSCFCECHRPPQWWRDFALGRRSRAIGWRYRGHLVDRSHGGSCHWYAPHDHVRRHCESFNAWSALFGRSLLIPIKQKTFRYLPNRYVRRCVMNGKRRPQWTELSRQPCWEYSDTEIEKRASSVLRWKIRYNSIRVTVEKGHLTSSWRSQLGFGLQGGGANGTQAERCDWSHQPAYDQRLYRPFHFLPRHRVEATKDVEDL